MRQPRLMICTIILVLPPMQWSLLQRTSLDDDTTVTDGSGKTRRRPVFGDVGLLKL